MIENRAGASGNIAMEAVAKAAPDGYTLGFANTGNITINPYLFRHLNYDPLNDLIPMGAVGTVPLFLVMNGKLPPKNLKEFIAYAKANPDKVSYAGAGAGTTPDLTGGEFARRAGLDKLVFVPFRGTAPAATAVISGSVQITFVSIGPHLQFVQNGTLRVLAAATPKRMSYAPDYPTFAEEGFPNFEMSTWFSLFAPAARRRRSWISSTAIPAASHDDPEMQEAAGRAIHRSADPDAAAIRRAGEGGRRQVGAHRARIRREDRLMSPHRDLVVCPGAASGARTDRSRSQGKETHESERDPPIRPARHAQIRGRAGPAPRAGEVRIRVHAATVNRVLDVSLRAGKESSAIRCCRSFPASTAPASSTRSARASRAGARSASGSRPPASCRSTSAARTAPATPARKA